MNLTVCIGNSPDFWEFFWEFWCGILHIHFIFRVKCTFYLAQTFHVSYYMYVLCCIYISCFVLHIYISYCADMSYFVSYVHFTYTFHISYYIYISYCTYISYFIFHIVGCSASFWDFFYFLCCMLHIHFISCVTCMFIFSAFIVCSTWTCKWDT